MGAVSILVPVLFLHPNSETVLLSGSSYGFISFRSLGRAWALESKQHAGQGSEAETTTGTVFQDFEHIVAALVGGSGGAGVSGSLF